MSKAPFSKGSEVIERVRKTKTSPLRLDKYRRKARSVIMRLREQDKGNSSLSEDDFASRKLSKSGQNLESLCYQAQFSGELSLRRQAMEALITIDRYAEATLKTLENSLEDASAEVRVQTIEVLEGYQSPLPELLIEKVIHLSWDKDILVRRAAAKALGIHPDPRSLGYLMGLMGTRDDLLRSIVENSISKISARLGPAPPKSDADA